MPRSKLQIFAQVCCVFSPKPLSAALEVVSHSNGTMPTSPPLTLLLWKQISKPPLASEGFPRAVEHLSSLCSCRTVLTCVPQTCTVADHHSLLGMTSQCLGLNLWPSEVCGWIVLLRFASSLEVEQISHYLEVSAAGKTCYRNYWWQTTKTKWLRVIWFSGHAIKVARLFCLDRPTQDFNLCDHHKYVKVSNLYSNFLEF